MVVGVASPCTGDKKQPMHLVPKFLQHPHELIVHFIDATTSTASHLGLAEVGSDHVNHDSSHGEKECSATDKPATSKFPIRFQL